MNKDLSKKEYDDYVNDPLAAQVHAGGKSKSLAVYNDKILCLSELGTLDVEPHYINGCRVDAIKFKDWLLSNGWTQRRIETALHFDEKDSVVDSSTEIWINQESNIYCSLHVSHTESMYINKNEYDDFIIISESEEKEKLKEPIISQIELHTPIKLRSKLTSSISDIIQKLKSLHKPVPRESSVGVISYDGHNYYVKSFSLAGKIPDFIHVDEHYGEGFNDFHMKLIERIKNETKGLILFHGEPGTGKTQYIRMLLDQLTRTNKSILYVPPGFSDQLTDPIMIEFISEWILEEDRDCILLIEDAEPLLETRNGANGRSTGISNLLNMTDGILNDMLGLMVIATFNTSISQIDSALLRPQRLLARKEFGKINKERAEKLASVLGIEMPDITYPATLAEFYANKKGQNILFHAVQDEKDKVIGFFNK